jgi:biotin carboxyl carrier protein
MELVVRQGEREEKVTVRRAEPPAHGYVVTVGDRIHRVDAAAAGAALSLRFGVAGDGEPGSEPAGEPAGEQHEVSVRPMPPSGGGVYQVVTAAGAVAVEVVDPLTALVRRGGAGTGGRRRARVDAYMPGRVVAVLAVEGSEVKAGDGVIVLEAMKMQNEIQAEHAGRIAKIFVQPGQPVEGGDPLFELE